MFIYISFKSRTNLMTFYKLIKTYINASIVNTPRTISISCSLSIKTEYRHVNFIHDMIKKTHIDNLIGVFLIKKLNTHEQVERII